MTRRKAFVAGLAIICFGIVGFLWSHPNVINQIMTFQQLVYFKPARSASQAIDVQGTSTFRQDVTVAEEVTGGNAAAKIELIGLPAVKYVALAAGTNGTTETTAYMDDSPAGEWAPVDADVTESADTTYYRVGSTSYKMAIATTADADDGAIIDITNDNLESNESIGFWIYSDLGLAAGDLTLLIDDTSADTDFDLPEIVPYKWQWVEIDVTSLAAGTGDVVDKVGITLSAAGAAKAAQQAFNVYLDGMFKWDSTDEETLGVALVQDGVLGILAVATAAGSANTHSLLAEQTDYGVNYQTGNDVIFWITDQSANSNTAMVAYQ